MQRLGTPTRSPAAIITLFRPSSPCHLMYLVMRLRPAEVYRHPFATPLAMDAAVPALTLPPPSVEALALSSHFPTPSRINHEVLSPQAYDRVARHTARNSPPAPRACCCPPRTALPWQAPYPSHTLEDAVRAPPASQQGAAQATISLCTSPPSGPQHRCWPLLGTEWPKKCAISMAT